MNERLICLLCLIVGYFFGCVQTAYIVGKAKGIDIRTKGSGNLGATNTVRVLGAFWGVLTAVCDIAKVYAAEFFMYLLIVPMFGVDLDRITVFLYTGFGVVLGHNFPFYLKFKGGKGVAATAAVLISLGDWKMILIGVCLFFGISAITRYVSLASMSLVVVELILFIIFTQVGLLKLKPEYFIDCYVIMILMTALVVFQHRANIGRLIKGKENRFSFRKQKEN